LGKHWVNNRLIICSNRHNQKDRPARSEGGGLVVLINHVLC
jgi:hypothetical protein